MTLIQDQRSAVPTTERQQSEDVVRLLQRPGSYPDGPLRVETIETHISWVFLTNAHAYKLKKPVSFDFLDFSTARARRQACQDEVQLNRRLAPHVYVGVVPVTRSVQGHLRLDGSGTPVDWVVKMRRLRADRALDRLIASHRLSPSDITQLAAKLAGFYQQLPPETIRSVEYRQEIEHHVRDNYRELQDPAHGLPVEIVKRVHRKQLRFLTLWRRLFDGRVCDGRIIEGHGDLRPEHIYLVPSPVIIDCIEFNREFRTLDVADELGFLAMECDRLGADQVGNRVIEHYCRISDDHPPVALLYFYKGYRACVRSKVHALRAQQLTATPRGKDLETAAAYLRLADQYEAQLGPPLLLVVRGLTGTGKSTLAQALAEVLHMELLQTDVIRREMFGPSPHPARYNQGHYEPGKRRQVYVEMFRQAAGLLEQGLSVVLDGSFLSHDLRRQAVATAQRLQAAPLLLRCGCAPEVALQRIAKRQAGGTSASEAWPELYAKQRQAEEPDAPTTPTCRMDTTQSVPMMVDAVCDRLRALTAEVH